MLVNVFGTPNSAMNLGGLGQVARLLWPDPASAQAGSTAAMQSGALFSELNTLAGPSESTGCGSQGQVPGQATTEQCTAAFYDGTPTQEEYDQQAALAAIALDQMPAPIPGQQTLVAVIDTGIDPTHPSLAGSLAAPGFDFLNNSVGGYDLPNGLDDDHDGVIDEAYGHGTHVSGLILLVDPSALLLPYRVLNSDGNGTAYDVAQAIYQAEIDGAQVINLSLGLSGVSLAVENALEGVTEDGVIVVTSAGNTGHLGVGALAASEETIAVAAVDNLGVLAPFASYGPAVDIVAPGVGLYSAMPGGQFAWWSGSSMAAAVATGAICRLCSSTLNSAPELAADSVVEGGVPVDTMNPGLSGNLGDGMVNLREALLALLGDG